jgi:multidrug resistance efflux pump
MSSKPVIPTPPAVRWREFRVKIVPFIVFVAMAVAATGLWRSYVVPVSMVGRVESIQTEVACTQGGTVTQLRVTRFQKVSAGDPIAEIITTDPKIIAASMDVIRAEVEMMRAGMSPADTAQRSTINYEDMRMNWMKYRTELATARVNFQFAENEFQRSEKLYKEKVLSASEYEKALALRDAYKKEIEEKSVLVANAEDGVKRLEKATEAAKSPETQLHAAINVSEQKLKLAEAQMNPVVVRSPIDGSVVMIHRYNGENVGAGVPIVTIGAVQSDRIVGYIRQPFYGTPEKDMLVRVRTRGSSRREGVGKILAVGPQLQPLNDAFMTPTRLNNLVDLGLPVYVSMPPELKSGPGEPIRLHPGEFVDMTLIPGNPL